MRKRRPPRRLGLMGGMGPEATVLLMSRIIAATSARLTQIPGQAGGIDDCDHIPLIVDNNTQVPSRILALIDGDGEDPGPVLAEMARKLEAYGAEALIMPCNTAHTYADQIERAVSVPFLDMIEATVAAVAARARPVARIGVLASPATRITGVFDRVLGAAGYHLVWPASDAAVLATIRHIKARGPDAEALAALGSLAAELETSGVDVVLIGCTEFSLLTRQLPVGPPPIDTLDVLAEAAVAFALAETQLDRA